MSSALVGRTGTRSCAPVGRAGGHRAPVSPPVRRPVIGPAANDPEIAAESRAARRRMAARSAAGERDVAPAAAVRGSDQAGMFRSIPIIDLSRLRESNAGQRAALLSELREVCHTVGFMYVTNHGKYATAT